MSKKFLLTLLLIFAMALVACGGGEETAENTASEAPAANEAPAENAAPAEEMAPAVSELTIFWAEWDPANYLQQIGNMYEQETGIKVKVVQEPWGSFGTVFNTEMAARGDSWDMVVGDSQWLGTNATQGNYINMTDFMNENGLTDSVTPATLQYYGEYPPGSGDYWAYPTEGDANGWAYRKDLFEDPDEMAAFEAEYGYPLAPPETYAQLFDIANFFTRPDEGLWGAAIYTQVDYDALVMGFQDVLFSYGANWSDENFNPEGQINSPEAVAALELYAKLYQCCQPPGMSNAFFNEVNDAMVSGQAAMGMNYFAFFPGLANPESNPYADVTGYFINPAGPNGDQYAALGGQGISVISHISPERQQASLDFIKWFGSDAVQKEWGAIGGYSANKQVLADPAFLDQTPYNRAFAQTMTMVKDFYNIPGYDPLLFAARDEIAKYVLGGEGDPQEILNAVAQQQADLLRESGFLK
jgi:multiple sugar transport system substrate-binding protein